MKAIQRILALTDFSADADKALARAARVAAEHHAALQLLHVVSEPTIGVLQELSPLASANLEHALLAQSERALEEAAGAAAAASGVQATYEVRKGGVLREVQAAAKHADLLVLGARGTNPVRDFVLGTMPERLLGVDSCPVLVVRRTAAAHYQRVLVAVGEPAAAPVLLAAAAAIAPKAEIHVLHATDLPFEGRLRVAGVGEDELQSYRRRQADRAMAAIQHATAALPGAWAQRVVPIVARGNAIEALVEHERATGADLVVMGKHAAVIGDVLLGSTTRHVLADAACDVLVIALADPGTP